MTDVGTDHFLLLSAALFIIGMMGVLIRRNMIIIFMCVELMVTAANITLVAFGWENNSMSGQSFVDLHDRGCRGRSGGRPGDHPGAEPPAALGRHRRHARVAGLAMVSWRSDPARVSGTS